MDNWIVCAERMPKREPSSTHSDWVLVTIEVDHARMTWFARYRFVDHTWWDPEGREAPGVTAWRELPEPFDGIVPRLRPAARWSLPAS
jgi:hypothetical protein